MTDPSPASSDRPAGRPRRSFLGVFVRVLVLGIGVAVVGATMASCATRPPRLSSVDAVQRLDGLDRDWPGLDGQVDIAWDEHLIPFISAGSDRDAAYAIGLVHAPLRLGQMELLRRVSQGRFSEMGGPMGEAHTDVGEAVKAAARAAGRNDLVLALGSFVLAGEVKSFVRSATKQDGSR